MFSRIGFLLACVFLTGLLIVGCDSTPTATPEPAAPAAPPTAPPTSPPTDTPPATDPPPPTAAPTAVPTLTPTPTPNAPPQMQATTAPSNNCADFAGSLEIAILVGPAEVAGLEPHAVGSIPLACTDAGDPCTIQGQGPISYEAVLSKAWGTYGVTMDLDFYVIGTCSGAPGQEQLDLAIEMSGQQLISVKSAGFSGDYPWEGTQTRDVTLPLEEGASAMGEGWGVVLHIGQ